MTMQAVEKFLQQEGQDPALQETLASGTDRVTVLNQVVQIGQAKGYDFTPIEAEECLKMVATQLDNQSGADGELNEEDLEAVSGGITPTFLAIGGGILSGAASFGVQKGLGRLFGR